MRVLVVILAVLAVVPGWTGVPRLDLLHARPAITARPVMLDPRDPSRRTVGGLTYLGGVELASRDPAFGGYSSLTVAGDRFTLLSDGGDILRFRMGADWRPRAVTGAALPAGPGTGWEKKDRDAESMATDGRHIWVGFERANAIWRYDAAFFRGDGRVRPRAMRRWWANGGPEALARLPGGGFAVISEQSHTPARWWTGSERSRLRSRDALLFAGDPLADPRPRRFAVMVAGRADISDAAALPGGDLVLVEREFVLPFRFVTTIARAPAAELRPGQAVRPITLATLGAPLIAENFEGIAVTREGGATIMWIVSDDNQSILQRTLLLKFRLGDG